MASTDARQKTILITGCSEGGIGHALAKEFHRQGLHVIATARRMEAMSELTETAGITTLQLDVTDEESVRQVRDGVSQITGGKLDILVNNAGQGYTSACTDLDINRVRNLFDVNLFGVMVMVKEFIPLLIASQGRIVQIGSIAAIVPVPFGAAYNATKAALHAYGNTLRVELAPFNVDVVTIVTGGVKSNITKPNSIPEGSLYHPMDDLFQARRVRMSQEGAMETGQYARTVVSAVLKKRPSAWFWSGTFSWMAWLLDTFFGKQIFDGPISKRFGLNELPERIKNKDKTV